MVVSLPSHITGFVSITEISEPLAAVVERAAMTDEDQEEELPNLRDFFYVGQWVRCVIMTLDDGSKKAGSSSVRADGNGKHSRRIELSLKPGLVNIGVASKDLGVG